jgi:hypothetical protein
LDEDNNEIMMTLTFPVVRSKAAGRATYRHCSLAPTANRNEQMTLRSFIVCESSFARGHCEFNFCGVIQKIVK